jgi:hypothetical protein
MESIFNTTELLELTLCALPLYDRLRVRSVSMRWKNIIERAPSFKDAKDNPRVNIEFDIQRLGSDYPECWGCVARWTLNYIRPLRVKAHPLWGPEPVRLDKQSKTTTHHAGLEGGRTVSSLDRPDETSFWNLRGIHDQWMTLKPGVSQPVEIRIQGRAWRGRCAQSYFEPEDVENNTFCFTFYNFTARFLLTEAEEDGVLIADKYDKSMQRQGLAVLPLVGKEETYITVSI